MLCAISDRLQSISLMHSGSLLHSLSLMCLISLLHLLSLMRSISLQSSIFAVFGLFRRAVVKSVMRAHFIFYLLAHLRIVL